jgi:hypothetical protein
LRKKAVKSTMSDKQYRDAIKVLGLTQDGSAEFLGVSLRTSHGYANGQPVPDHVAKLLRLMIRLEIRPDDPAFGAR